MWSFTRRSTILGLPIGPRRTDWESVARVASGAVAFVAGMAITRRLVGRSDDELPRDEAGHFAPRSTDGEDVQSPEREADEQRRAG